MAKYDNQQIRCNEITIELHGFTFMWGQRMTAYNPRKKNTNNSLFIGRMFNINTITK